MPAKCWILVAGLGMASLTAAIKPPAISSSAEKNIKYAPAAERITDDFSDLSVWRGSSKKAFKKVVIEGQPALALAYPGQIATRIFPMLPEQPKKFAVQGITFEARGEKGRTIFLPVSVGTSPLGWAWNYYCYVPIKGDKFQTVTIPWRNFVEPRGTTGGELGGPDALPIWGINVVRFGDNWKNAPDGRYLKPATIYIRNLRFAPTAPSCRSVRRAQGFGNITKVIAKMRRGDKVSIWCSGDSLTATRMAGRRYGDMLEELLQKEFKNPHIKIRIIAVSGAHSYDLRVWSMRDFYQQEAPDLLTYTLGFNDRSAAISPEVFHYSITDYLHRVSALTQGKTAILLMPTMPARSLRKHMQDSFADVFRQIAREKRVALVDIPQMLLRIPDEEYDSYFFDLIHFNEKGHKFVAQKLLEYFKNN